MRQVRVRQARAGDVKAIAVVHVRSWQAAYQGMVPQDYLDGLDPAQRETLWDTVLAESAWPSAGILVLEDQATVAGFAHFCPTRDRDGEPAQVAEITAIYLMPHAWGIGAGRQLMTAVLEVLAAAGYQQATLWVLHSNRRARRFYHAGGWRADGTVKTDDTRGLALTEVRYRRLLP
jgi:GNAT superfamily N-acetyltransferase